MIQKVPRKFIAIHDLVHSPVYFGLLADVQVEYVVISLLHRVGCQYFLSSDQNTFGEIII